MKAASSISIALLITFASPILALSDEPIAIGEIVADPDLYHLKLVTVQGTVRQVKALAPYVQTSGATCYGAYTFRLEDDTGAIEIDVLGMCGNPVLKVPGVIEGDRVIVQAQILAPGHSTPPSESESSPLFGRDLQALQAIAGTISRSVP